jgi:glutaminyl-peptide cyclotransferase
MGLGNIVIVGALGTAFLCVLLAVMYPNVNPRMRKKDALQHFRKLNEVTDNYRFRNVFLPGILKVRVPGTNGNTEVREFIESQLRVLNDWTVEIDDFNDSTPIGTRRFVNIVATLNPLARKRLVLAAHYDSKLIRADSTSGEFVGATDSAVPCAMLLDVAFSLQTLLRQRKTVLLSIVLHVTLLYYSVYYRI